MIVVENTFDPTVKKKIRFMFTRQVFFFFPIGMFS